MDLIDQPHICIPFLTNSHSKLTVLHMFTLIRGQNLINFTRTQILNGMLYMDHVTNPVLRTSFSLFTRKKSVIEILLDCHRL